MQLAEARVPYSPSETDPRLTMNTRGSSQTPAAKRTLPVKSARTDSASTTCTAMCGNGLQTVTTATTTERRTMAPLGSTKDPIVSVSREAVGGTVIREVVTQRLDCLFRIIPRTMTSDFVSRE